MAESRVSGLNHTVHLGTLGRIAERPKPSIQSSGDQLKIVT